MTETRKFRDNFYILEEERVRQFLLVGEDEALLIDTGFPDSHVKDKVAALTDKPVRVVLTHADGDHTGGLADFGACWAHPREWPRLPQALQLHPLAEGDVFSCGGYRLEVVELLGHAPGSIALLDREHRLLLPGDSVQKGGPIYMFGGHRDLDAYIAGLERILPLACQVDLILPCHNACPIDPSYIEKDLEDARALRAGALPGEPTPGMPCSTFHGRWTDFYY